MGAGRCDIKTLSRDYSAGHEVPLHFHERDQLVYATRGVMTVHTRAGTWVVPTHRAVWIPARIPHSIVMSGTVAMRTLYIARTVHRPLPRTCSVVNVSPLLRELILRACEFSRLRNTIPEQRHLVAVILDQLRAIDAVPLQLPSPSDPRAMRLAGFLLAKPSDPRPLAHFCKLAGAGKRTMERIFQHDVGSTLGKWRQQLRLMEAMRYLAEGANVTQAALEAGYSTPSAFISMFRRALGTTPTLYFRLGSKRG